MEKGGGGMNGGIGVFTGGGHRNAFKEGRDVEANQ